MSDTADGRTARRRTPARTTDTGTDPILLSSSAVMAAGTVVSRLSGFVRSILLAAALGAALHADVFNIANTVPNMLYILLAGGVFNAVLVPQLVRAMKNDPDGGDAYTNRIITLAALFLAVVTVVLVIAAPLADAAVPGPGVLRPPSWPSSASRSSTSRATACRRSSSTACSCWSGRCSTPAAASGR